MVFAEIPDERSELNKMWEQLTDLQNQINNQQQTSDLSIGTGRTDVESFAAVNTGLKQLMVLGPLDQVITKVLVPAGEIPAAHTNAIVSHATDDPLNLYYLENPAHDGQIKFLHPEAGKSLVLKTGGHFANTSDITINDGFFTIMMWSTENGNKWLPLQTGSGGGGLANVVEDLTPQLGGDLDYQTLDGINIDRLIFDQAAGNALVLTTTGITSNATGDFNVNVPTGGEYDTHIANVLKMRLSQASSVTTLDVTGVLGSQINVSETTAGKVGSMLQGSSALQFTTTGTTHEFLVGVSSIFTIDSGGLVMNQDIDFATFDGINIDRFLFSQTSGSSLTSGVTGITSDSSSNMVFNIPNNSIYNLMSNASSILSLDNTTANLFLSLFARDNEIPILQLTRIDSTPTTGAEIGRVTFVGVDTSGSTQEEFARITVDGEDLTIGSVDGSMHLQVDIASLTTAFISLNNSNDGKVSLWKNIIMQAGIDVELNGNDLIISADSLDKIYHSGTRMEFEVDGAKQFHIVAGGIALESTGKSATLPNISMTPHDLTPLSVNGNIYYDLSEQKFKGFQNGSWQDIITAGGGGANTALSNLTAVAINTALLPNVDGALNLGSSSKTWNDVYAERYRIETGGSSTININEIISDAGGMIFNTPSGDRYEFNIAGIANGIYIDDGEIGFLQTGRQHKILAQSLALDIVAENTGDVINIWNGAGASNETMKIENFRTTWKTSTTDTTAYLFQLIQNNNTPADFRTIGNIDFIAENSVSADQIYGRISVSSQDITDATEDGLMQFGIMSGGALISVIDIEGGGSSGLLGFYGGSPVAKQTGVAVSAAGIHAALVALGLIT